VTELKHKSDFDQCLARFEAWWQCEILDRPPVTLSVRPSRPPRLPEKRHASVRDRWLDTEYRLDRFEASLDGAEFFAENFPRFNPNLGPDLVATLFGCELTFGNRTSWSAPIVEAPREILSMQPDLDSFYWSKVREMTDQSLQRGAGRWLTGITDMHTNGDLVAALRGPQELCLDLMDDPEGVRLACEHVTDFFWRVYEDLWTRLQRSGQPTTLWCPILDRGRMYMVSCDFICLISPQMYAQSIRPCHEREIACLERTMFHLDGPGALKHMDAVLSLEGLDGFQWVYGAGNGPGARWIGVYQRAQQAGKCLQVKARDMDDAITLTEHLRPEGVWLTVGGEYTRDEAQAFVDRIARWACGRRA